MEDHLSDTFQMNFVCWKIFGIWPGKSSSKYYKFYSFFYVFIFFVIYNVILTVNLYYTPLEVDLIIEEAIYYFNEVAIMLKVATILIWREKILALFDILDCNPFKGKDEVSKEIIVRNIQRYKTCWKLYAVQSHFAVFLCCIVPVIMHFLPVEYQLKFPVSKYLLLSVETRDKYFGWLYSYQVSGLYGQMMYNVNIDSFFAGLLYLAITQMEVLDHQLRSLRWEKQNGTDNPEQKRVNELKYCLRHYDEILRYCAAVQNIFSLMLFVQFGMASAIICVISCATFLPNSEVVPMLSYLTCMTVQIFVPAWLGTQLTYKSKSLVFAAYNSEWVPRSEPFKSSIKIFMERANTPIIISGMNLFTLNLENFIAIMKTAYSFLTLVRNVQENNNN
ncbi:odorant receptor 49b-like [Epargyreus clarus]|uniref:odorant receptor 49b-like n=1 Tax=Epargyreus clarus TaxID=520877 RepID=UPI003C2F52D4